MNVLIEKLQAANGPDYGLSQEIGKAVGAMPRYQHPGSEELWRHSVTRKISYDFHYQPLALNANMCKIHTDKTIGA